MFVETKKMVEREIKKLRKAGVHESTLKMIEMQIDDAVSRRNFGKKQDTIDKRKTCYQRSLNEISTASRLVRYAHQIHMESV